MARDGILAEDEYRVVQMHPLSRITGISFQRGPVDRLLGTGKLVVESPGERGQLALTGIPEVERVQSTLYQLVEDEQQRLAGEGRS